MNVQTPPDKLKAKDYATDQEVRWCPGCGDYAIVRAMQNTMAELQAPPEKTVFISGIGCAARFPYYMATYGFHTIHGRAAAIATGTKLANPDLDVWIISGDGDAMSIGGNHFIHLLRRNFDMNILMFNNRIYGLTKGQYSPTSEVGKVTYATPDGSIDFPFNPPALALGAGGTFIARTIDRELKHMQAIIIAANKHSGTSFVEIYQNCNIFNDGAFSELTEKEQKAESQLVLELGQPMVFGANRDKGLILDGSQPRVVELGKRYSIDGYRVDSPHDTSAGRRGNPHSRVLDEPLQTVPNTAARQRHRPFSSGRLSDRPPHDRCPGACCPRQRKRPHPLCS